MSSSFPVPSDTLLLCVDMQPAFVNAIAGGAEVLRRCEFAVAAAVGIGIPVAFTEQVPAKLGTTAPSLLKLAPDAPVWGKSSFSAFGDDAIRTSLLEKRRIRHLLLCGIETPICIYQTAAAARREELEVTLLRDALGARRADDADGCLAALARHGVHVLPTETVFYALLRETSHPFFRTFTRLVKSHHQEPATGDPALKPPHA